MRRIILTIEEAIAWIHSRKIWVTPVRCIQALLNRVDNPEKVPVIHVAEQTEKDQQWLIYAVSWLKQV